MELKYNAINICKNKIPKDQNIWDKKAQSHIKGDQHVSWVSELPFFDNFRFIKNSNIFWF